MSKPQNQPPTSSTAPENPSADSNAAAAGDTNSANESSSTSPVSALASTPIPRRRTSAQQPSQIARYVSFGLLLGVIGLVGFVFFEVMLSFLIPLFLAAILVVVFRPLHRWFLEKTGDRPCTSALLTTSAVVFAVLVPVAVLLLMAVVEGRDVLRQFNTVKVEEGIRTARTKLRLDMPAARQLRDIESRLAALQETGTLNDNEIERHRSSLYEIEESAKILAEEVGRVWPEKDSAANLKLNGADQGPVTIDDNEASDDGATDEVTADSTAAISSEPVTLNHWEEFARDLQQTRTAHFAVARTPVNAETEELSRQRQEQIRDYRNLINDTAKEFSEFKSELLGGKTKAWMAELVNPTDEQIANYTTQAITYLKNSLLRFSGDAVSFLGRTAVGFAIMIIGLYFFLLDGPGMIKTLQHLSPIDDEHEQELVTEFAKVSRAVVVATLLSALVQGLLAGIGFYFVGLDSVFLLTVLSAVLAMVPFVGAAAVWVPCCLYLYFIENNLTAAIGLAIYGTAIISMADNVIKPYVLHGQSNLHPLLALLSVLGGVATLGPIGILVGPMIVAFLQTLLKILQREIATIGGKVEPEVTS